KAERRGIGEQLARREDGGEDSDRPGRLTLGHPPQAEDGGEGQGRDPGEQKEDANRSILQAGADAVAGGGQPAPAVTGQGTLPVLIALIEDRHDESPFPARSQRGPTALRNSSSRVARRGRRWRICSRSARATSHSRVGSRPAGTLISSS